MAEALIFRLRQALSTFGLDISRPGFDGPLPEALYTGQIIISLAMGGIVNLYMIGVAVFAGSFSIGYKDTERQWQEKYGWSAFKAALMLRLLVLFFVCPFIIFMGGMVMNAYEGWVVFHIRDFFVAIVHPIFFIFLPACPILVLVIGVGEYLVRDLTGLLRKAV